MTSLKGLKKSFYGETIGTPVASVHPAGQINITDLETASKNYNYNFNKGIFCYL